MDEIERGWIFPAPARPVSFKPGMAVEHALLRFYLGATEPGRRRQVLFFTTGGAAKVEVSRPGFVALVNAAGERLTMPKRLLVPAPMPSDAVRLDPAAVVSKAVKTFVLAAAYGSCARSPNDTGRNCDSTKM